MSDLESFVHGQNRRINWRGELYQEHRYQGHEKLNFEGEGESK